MRARAGIAILPFALTTLVPAVAACGDVESSQRRKSVPGQHGPGRILYLTYCQSCHGAAGQGDGPVASSLRTPPADLTLLWKRYGMPLDRQALESYVDGRLLAEIHGGREMPIWGDEFFADEPPETPNLEKVRRRLIEVLVDYLETLQSEQRA